MKKSLHKLVDLLSGQWILDSLGANGGTVVVLRTLFSSAVLVAAVILLQAVFDTTRVGPMSWTGFVKQVFDLGSVIGAIFAGVYAAFYARFVSQWSYLAGVFNLIKQAESAQGSKRSVIAEWKAGYIEDAETLHLMCKAGVAPVVHAWVADKAVARAYVRNTPGGELRLEHIRRQVRVIYDRENADAVCKALHAGVQRQADDAERPI